MTPQDAKTAEAIDELKDHLTGLFSQQTTAIVGDRDSQAPIPPSEDKVKIQDQGPDADNSKTMAAWTKLIKNVFMPEFLQAQRDDPAKLSRDSINEKGNSEAQLESIKTQVKVSKSSEEMLEKIQSTGEDELLQQTDSEKRLATEKTVVKQPDKVVLAGIEDGPMKKFGGLFGALKGVFGGGQTPAPPSPKEDSGMGFWGWLGTILLGFRILGGALPVLGFIILGGGLPVLGFIILGGGLLGALPVLGFIILGGALVG